MVKLDECMWKFYNKVTRMRMRVAFRWGVKSDRPVPNCHEMWHFFPCGMPIDSESMSA